MDAFREAVSWTFEGPLAEAAALPELVLYGVVLTFLHAAGADIVGRLRDALAPRWGEPEQMRRTPLGAHLRFRGRPPLVVQARGRKVRVRLAARIAPGRLKALVAALAEIPGARDAALHGQALRFAEPGTLRSGTVE